MILLAANAAARGRQGTQASDWDGLPTVLTDAVTPVPETSERGINLAKLMTAAIVQQGQQVAVPFFLTLLHELAFAILSPATAGLSLCP